MAVLLWCLYPLAPAKRIYELTRHLLQLTVEKLSDQRWITWLCHNPDDPRSFPAFERILHDLNASIDLIIHLRARDILGLPNHDWTTPRQHDLQPRRSRSFADLWRQLELCVLRFGDIDRLAARRAIKLQRLLEAAPRTANEIAIAARAATTQQQSNPDCRASSAPTGATTPTTPTTTPARAGMRVRAPPWKTRLPNAHCPPPLPPRDRDRRRMPGANRQRPAGAPTTSHTQRRTFSTQPQPLPRPRAQKTHLSGLLKCD